VQYASDLHLEFEHFTLDRLEMPIDPRADLLVLAGDLHTEAAGMDGPSNGDIQMNPSKRRDAEFGGAGRWSARPKMEAMPGLLQDENIDALSRELPVLRRHRLAGWAFTRRGGWSAGNHSSTET
jgi:hypothetical protein